MNIFIKKTLLFALPCIIALSVLFTLGRDYLAAYRITNSYSFNEKIKFLPPPQTKKILAIGSSMSLNNLYSPGIIKYLRSDNYVNGSVWGLSIMDAEALAPVFENIYHPSIVICVSNVMDFATPQIEYDTAELADFLQHKKVPFYQWFSFCSYYLKHSVKNFLNFSSNRVYTSLVFDKWGGVPLSVSKFQTRKTRWNEPLHFDLINADSYKSLEKLAAFYTKNNIQFIFIQSPVRESIKKTDYKRNMAVHTNKIRQILEHNGQVFKDLSVAVYSDTLFVDSAHLNENGARRLTKEVFDIAPANTGIGQ